MQSGGGGTNIKALGILCPCRITILYHDVLLIGMVHTLVRSIVDLLTDSVEDGGCGVGGRKKVGREGEETGGGSE